MSIPVVNKASLMLQLFELNTSKIYWETTGALTSIQAPGQQVPLAGGTLKVRSGPVYKSTGLSGLSLCPSAVSKLRTHHQEALRRRLWRHQPVVKKKKKNRIVAVRVWMNLSDRETRSILT